MDGEKKQMFLLLKKAAARISYSQTRVCIPLHNKIKMPCLFVDPFASNQLVPVMCFEIKSSNTRTRTF